MLSNDGVVEDGRAYADQATVFQGASMDDRTVTDGHIVANQGGYAFINVNDGAILNIAAFTDPDDSVVSAKDRAEPDAGSRSDFYITDDSMLSTGLGDHDLNMIVNFNDFVKLSNDFGNTGTGWDQGNGNTDDVTNFNDFVRVSNNFGMSFASGSNVPEPTALVLVAIGGLVAMRRWKA